MPDKTVMLIKVDPIANNNKFYEIIQSGNTLNVRYGRVGNDGQRITKSGGDVAFDRLVASKEKKGYQVAQVVGVDVGGTSSPVEEKAVRESLLTGQSLEIEQLVTRLLAHNAHEIVAASGGQIKVEDGVVQTPLGILTLGAIQSARDILAKVEKAKTDDYRGKLAVEFVSIVPQDIGRFGGWHKEYFDGDGERVKQQSDFLDQLEASVGWYENQLVEPDEGDPTDYSDLFTLKVTELTEDSEYSRIEALFKKTLDHRHQSRHHKLKKIYVVTDSRAAILEATAKRVGNVKEYWHGTRVHNVLSILKSGLYIPKSHQVQSGSMYGKGIYTSEASTKSLNYATGYWGGGRSSTDCFMFLADVAMGTPLEPRRTPTRDQYTKLYAGKPVDGQIRHSINVKAGTAVLNHEAIVWDETQVRLKYLCEFST